MQTMQSYELRFRSRAALERAFSMVMSCEHVVDCIVTRSPFSLRFRAPAGREAERVFERIRKDGHVVTWNTTPRDRPATPWWEASQPGRNWG
jgi:hypothetical protein